MPHTLFGVGFGVGIGVGLFMLGKADTDPDSDPDPDLALCGIIYVATYKQAPGEPGFVQSLNVGIVDNRATGVKGLY